MLLIQTEEEMIKFDEVKQHFYLHTKNTTYVMGIFRNELLLHLYWGKRLQNGVYTNYELEMGYHDWAPCDYRPCSTDILPLEYSTYGCADLRKPAFSAKYNDGSCLTKLVYKGYEIIDGKPALEGLPAVYCEENDCVQTLVVRLCDEWKDVDVFLSYSVFEDFDAITRSVQIVNHGERMEINTVMSATVDFYGMPQSDFIHLDGAWGRERAITRSQIQCGNQNVESRHGTSSHLHNPFIAICDKDANENHGDIYGFNLVYSGNFSAGIELNPYHCGRAYIGINPFQFNWILENGESFQTPETVMVYSGEGIGGMSRIYHKLYRTRLCRGKYRDTERFVLLNNWEATYFDFNEEKIVQIAKKAAEIGIDTMVLDDGWFGDRNDDTSGLGDWYENTDKLPGGLRGLSEKINALGMKFGLWFEPEMVSPNSNLYKEHPDWILHIKGRNSTLSRSQLTLDLSRKDVCDFIITAVGSILDRANIEYVKWDMNRYMSEAGSALLGLERQCEVMHRYMLGLYYVLETLISRFSNVLFEGCAGGGGRFDPGILHYMPQIWTSDDSDAVERMEIQYGTSLVYPYSTMGAHVSACPNHQVARTVPFEKRCNVAMPGQFGFELDLNKCTEEEIQIARNKILQYRELQEVFHKGDCYRLRSPFENHFAALQFVSEDKQTVILSIESKKATANAWDEYIRLEGLEKTALYMQNGEVYAGDYLMNKGVHFKNGREHNSCLLVYKRMK